MSRITLLEMLLRANLIDEVQFDEALQNRVLHGGKIGTSLIEMGFVSEEDLARFLSRKLSVPYASPEHLKYIKAETIAVLPQSLALKYQAIPLKCDKKKLALAMVDPADLKAVDEISFATGFIIRPVVAPEVRLMEALAHYYGAEIPPRYRQIIKNLEERAMAVSVDDLPNLAVNDAAPAAASFPEAKVPSSPESVLDPVNKPAEDAPEPAEEIIATSEPAAATAVRETVIPCVPAHEPDWADAGGTAESDLLVADIVEDEWINQVEKFSIDEFSKKLSWAADREEIAQIIMEYLGPRFSRSALFTLRAGAAYGWKGTIREKEIPHFHQFRLPLDSPSVLKTVADKGGEHLGPVPETVSNALLQEALGGDGTAAAIALPITVTGTTVGIVFGEIDDGDLAEESKELKKILFKAGLAFEILICREKIQMMTGADSQEKALHIALRGGAR